MGRSEESRERYEEAMRLLAEGEYTQAAEAFSTVLQLDASWSDAAVGLARALEKLGAWTRAVDAWELARALAPDSIEAATGRAEALRQAGCYHRALLAYDEALALRGDQLFALAGKGEVLRMLGYAEPSLQWFQAALEVHPDHAFALRGKAAALGALRRYAEALPYWEDAIQFEPQSSFALNGRDEAEEALEARRERAERGEVEPAPIPTPPMPEGEELEALRSLEWGRALLIDLRATEAVPAFERALEARPSDGSIASELASALDACNDFDGAARAWRQVLALEPTRASAATQLAETLRKSERYDDAVEAYDAALALDDGQVFALAGRAEALRMLGRNEEALEWFDRALERKPTHAFAMRGRAAALNALERFEEAVDLWRHSLDLDPGAEFARSGLKHSEAELARRSRQVAPDPGFHSEGEDSPARARAREHHDLGRAWVQQGRYGEAAQACEAALDLDPTWDEPRYLLGVVYEEDGQYLQAVRVLDQVLDSAPEHVDAWARKADALRKHNDLPASIEAYDSLLALRPDDLRGLSGRAESLRMLGRFEEAAEWFDRVLDERPTHFFSLCGKAATMNALRRFDEALPLWERALDETPTSSFVQRGLAHCEAELRRERGDLEGGKALSTIRIKAGVPAVTGTRQEAQAALKRGKGFAKERQHGRAILEFERALDLDPSLAEAALRLGMSLEGERRYADAIEAYDRCLTLDPESYQACTNMGEAYRKNEQYDQAIRAYDRALEIHPNFLYALAGRGECMRMLGEYQGSLTWFDKALAIEPRHTFAIQGKAASLNALQRFRDALPLWNRALEIDAHSQFALDGKAYCEAQLREDADEDEEESSTPTLDEQGRDLTALARSGRLGRVVGRQIEMRAVMKTLMRRQKANPLLLGDPGVGKTAVVEGVAQLLAADPPRRLEGLRIIELSMGSLVAGTKYRGTFEDRLKAIIKEAKANPGIVLFIDEIHTLVGAGRTEGGSLDAANILKPALARGEINVIGATTMAEYRKHFESDSALERRFQPVTIEEPSHEETVHLLEQVQDAYAEHHQVTIGADALEACVQLAVRFVPDRRLPDKALDLLDEACAEASLSEQQEVSAATVAHVLAERTGIPVRKLTAEERERMSNMESHLSENVVGQETAIRALANTVTLSRAGLRDPHKPRGVFLFVGPTGVGKTELARRLADFLFPEGNALIKLDMSEFSDKFTGSRLLGAPPGYAGHGDEGQLTGRLRRRPYAVVLLDEFEKAHPEVQTMFLSLFDDGTVNDAEGRKVDAREAFFIMTTNAGADLGNRSRVGFGGVGGPVDRDVVLDRLKPYFRPELINRVDEVVVFQDLDDTALRRIVQLHLDGLAERAAVENVALSWDEEVVDLCVGFRRNPAFGARPALRAIDDLVAEPLGHVLLEGGGERARVYHAVVRDGQVVFTSQLPPLTQVQPEEEPV